MPRWRFYSMTQTYPFAVSSDEFTSKRVLVTGGTKGMGEAIVRRFLLSGAAVATTARSPLPQGQNPSLFVQTDIGTAEGVKKVVDRIQQEWHGLDILVNCLGGSEAPNGGFRALTDDDWQRAHEKIQPMPLLLDAVDNLLDTLCSADVCLHEQGWVLSLRQWGACRRCDRCTAQ